MTNEELIRRTAEGDNSAFDVLWTRLLPFVMNLCRGRVGREDARDLCQRVALKLWMNAGRFDPAEGTLIHYVAVMTTRILIDHIRIATGFRRKTYYRTRPMGDGFDMASAPTISLSNETKAEIETALCRLSDKQQDAIRLWARGIGKRKLSRMLGISEGTAGRVKFDAVKRLREMMPSQVA